MRDVLLKEFVNRVSAKYPRSAIVLFGSRARGGQRPQSDYDVAVISDWQGSLEELMLDIRGMKPSGLPLDLILLSLGDLNDPVVREMLKGCILLYDGLGLGSRLPCRPR